MQTYGLKRDEVFELATPPPTVFFIVKERPQPKGRRQGRLVALTTNNPADILTRSRSGDDCILIVHLPQERRLRSSRLRTWWRGLASHKTADRVRAFARQLRAADLEPHVFAPAAVAPAPAGMAAPPPAGDAL